MDTESLKDKLQDAKESLQEKAQEAVETVKEVASETAEKAQEVAADAKEVADKVVEEVKDAAVDAAEEAQEAAQAAVEDVKEVAQGVADEAKAGLDELKEKAQAVTEEKPAEPEPVEAEKNQAAPQGPATKLPTGRGLLKFLFFGIITCGIYQLVILTKISSEVNTVCKPHDHKSTMNFCLLFFVITPITLGIAPLVWWTRICNRMGNEMTRRRLPNSISAGTYWGWYVLGAAIVIGPLVFFYKFLRAQNTLNADYNQKG